VLPEFFAGDRLELQIWEGRTPVYRGALYVDREGEPMLRRVRNQLTGAAQHGSAAESRRRWWRRR
jgi:hypothetical protein